MGVRPAPQPKVKAWPVKKPRRAKMGARAPTQIRCRPHLEWIRTQPCLCRSSGDGWHCHGPVQAAHVRTNTDGGMGMKPSDFWSVPLCAKHHREQHQIGETAFQLRHRIFMRTKAMELAQRSPHRERWADA